MDRITNQPRTGLNWINSEGCTGLIQRCTWSRELRGSDLLDGELLLDVVWFLLWCRQVVPAGRHSWSTFRVLRAAENDVCGETEFCLVLARCVFVHSDN